jgi:hypothetical protein
MGTMVIDTVAALPFVQGPFVDDFEPFDDISGCDDLNDTTDDPQPAALRTTCRSP